MGCKSVSLLLVLVLFSSMVIAESAAPEPDKVDVIIKFKDSSLMKARINSKLDSLERLSIKKEEIGKIRKLIMSRYEDEMQVKRQFNLTNALSISITREALERLKKDPNVEYVFEDMPLHVFLNDASSIVGAQHAWNLDLYGINGTGETACVVDTGIDFSHPGFGSCQVLNNIYAGNEFNHSLTSSHPYSTSQTLTYKINQTGFTKIGVHFTNISLEPEWDFIKVLDPNNNNNTVGVYTGIHNNTWTPSVNGDTLYLRFESDETITDWGFSVDKIINGTSQTVMNYSGCEKIPAGWDFSGSITTSDDDYPQDDSGHGSHVSGIIISQDTTYKGVSPGSRVVSVKAMDSSGEGNTTDVIAAIEYCIENKNRFNISVISLSLGGGTYSGNCDSQGGIFTLFSEIVNEAVNQGIMVVAASGNQGSSSGIAFPACLDNVTSVGSTTKADAVDTAYSNSGTALDLLAPGTGITSVQLGGGYVSDSGTSMAGPFVAGAALLLRNFKRNENGSILTPDQIEIALRHGDNITDSRNSFVYPRINLTKAISYVDETPRITFIQGNLSCNCSNSYINITSTERITALIEIDGQNISMGGGNRNFYYNLSFTNGTHEFAVHAEDSTRNIVSSSLYHIDYPMPGSSLNLTLNGLGQNITVEKGNVFTINASLLAGDNVLVQLYIDGTNITENLTISMSYLTSSVGTINITARYPTSQNYSSSSRSLFATVVDTTPPAITLNSPQNNSVLNHSYQVFFNATTDEVSNCSILVDEQVLLDGSLEHTGTFNRYSNGTFTLSLNCTDGINSNLKIFTYHMNDTHEPGITSTASSTASIVSFSITSDEPANISVYLGGNREYSNFSLSHSVSFSSLSESTSYDYSIGYCDRIGNCGEVNGSKSTSAPSSGSSSGSSSDSSSRRGGGAVVISASSSDDKVTKVISNPADGKNSVDFSRDDINIGLVSLDLSDAPKGTVSVTLKKIEVVPEKLENAFEYYEINKTISSDHVKGVTIRFSIPSKWMNDKDAKSIGLFRYSDGWTKLPTNYLGIEGEEYRFVAESPGLSLFAIAYDEPKEVIPEEESTNINEITADVVTSPEINGTLEKPAPSHVSKAGIFLLISTIILAVLSVSIYGFLKKSN